MRLPNYKIGAKISEIAPFENYNATIRAEIGTDGVYRIVHWRTTILSLDTHTNRIIGLRTDYISQTTSALVGKILRALPRHIVEDYLPQVPKQDFKRVRGMLGIR